MNKKSFNEIMKSLLLMLYANKVSISLLFILFATVSSVSSVCDGIVISIITSADTINGTDQLSLKGEKQAIILANQLEPNSGAFIDRTPFIMLFKPTNASYYTAFPTVMNQNSIIIKSSNYTIAKKMTLDIFLQKGVNRFLFITPPDIVVFRDLVATFGSELLPFRDLPPRLKYTIVNKLCQNGWFGGPVLAGRY